MEEQLKDLLSQIYSPTSSFSLAPNVSESKPLTADEFRMYIYKVVPCTRRGPHSWVECSYCHPGEKASRRDPQAFNYAPIACPNMKVGEECTWDYCAITITDDPEDPDLFNLLINCTCGGGTRPRRKVSLPINPDELVVDCKACPLSIITLKKRVKVG
ncbi:hypothetical protein CEUSTIGMA_g11982.t1 [Chlamydomonas eustigma]|uniref:AtC3H23-like CCCH zinc finger domain-containing protein n=1 Tax=Chlamydomonas eustigma TaxID=1157962 RepID=A0A250XN99_9CHLO|nr:hypothetical protein CEUSTIGMA_g11982.t1 [Chlamydomonas eustigma]|eukprot:GAX84561.1 hypothetical protein CEUSTIGMA_g11982.t1 [Chlamydomonas eustigma]